MLEILTLAARARQRKAPTFVAIQHLHLDVAPADVDGEYCRLTHVESVIATFLRFSL
jgi:hypothetical protein